MSRKKTIFFTIITLVSGMVSFFNARLTALGKQEQAQIIPPNVAIEEEKFNVEAEGLITNIESLQKSLDSALEDPCTTDETIIGRANNIIKAHEQLIQQLGKHVVEIRQKLGEKNREYIMQLCAEAVSGPMIRIGTQGGRGGMMGGRNGMMNGRGGMMRGRNGIMNGRGGMMGRRGNMMGGRSSPTTNQEQENGGNRYRYGMQDSTTRGYGQCLRFRNRLVTRLQLAPEQVTLLQEKDPNFEAEALNLYEQLIAERQKLLAVFENPESNDNELTQQIDSFISSHSQLERRILHHVLVLRPDLTVEQQKWLIGLCRRFALNE
jgi:hypothetical protein